MEIEPESTALPDLSSEAKAYLSRRIATPVKLSEVFAPQDVCFACGQPIGPCELEKANWQLDPATGEKVICCPGCHPQ